MRFILALSVLLALLPVAMYAQDGAPPDPASPSTSDSTPTGNRPTRPPLTGGATQGEKNTFASRMTFSFGISALLFQEDYGLEAAPPPILPTLSLALALPPLSLLMFQFRLESTLDMYFTNYKWSDDLNCPLPTEIENRSAFVFGPMLGLQAQARCTLGRIMIRLNGGIAADFRIVLIAADLNDADMEEASAHTEKIKKYFYEGANFIFPVAGFGVDYKVNEKYAAGLDFRVWFPLSPPPAAASVDLLGGGRFGIGIRATVL
jgi:hypothetical protein